jgi:hypothetical protein
VEIKKVENIIYEVRGYKVMLDFNLAELYEVETKVLNQAVKRNIDRFPEDFMFRLSVDEWNSMRSQFVTASQSKRNIETTPYAFTEQGVAMLSGVLKSKKALEVNISIMRTFVFMRQYALTHKDLTDKLEKLESKFNKKFKDIHAAITYLIEKDMHQEGQTNRKKIGYK